MTTELENRFNIAMENIYRRAFEEAGYKATRFLQMVHEQGGYEAAKTLLYNKTVSDGYIALWERRRLDLTVEALVLKPEWNDLLSDREREIARKRLEDYGYKKE